MAGQRHRVGSRTGRAVAAALGAAGHVVVTVDLRAIGGSASRRMWRVPRDRARRTSKARSQTCVPARNTIFLAGIGPCGNSESPGHLLLVQTSWTIRDTRIAARFLSARLRRWPGLETKMGLRTWSRFERCFAMMSKADIIPERAGPATFLLS